MAVSVGRFSKTVNEEKALQVCASVTVTEEVPAARVLRCCVVVQFDNRKAYVPAGETVRVIEPLALTQEVLGAGVPASVVVELLLETVALDVAMQPLALVAVTVYVPAETPDKSSVAAPFDQSKV